MVYRLITKISVLVITATLGCTPSMPFNKTESRAPASMDGDSRGLLSGGVLNSVPPPLRGAVREYAQLIGLENYQSLGDVGSRNSGIVNFNWDLLQTNNCFRQLTTQFYLEVARRNAFYSRHWTPRTNYLFNNLGTNTSNTQVPTGWVWDLAMQMTQNDPNLAMSLIGMCGHDDTAQFPEVLSDCEDESNQYNCTSVNRQRLPLNPNQQAQYRTSQELLVQNFRHNFQPRDESGQNILDHAAEFLLGSEGLDCPSTLGAFYQQGSLGEQTLLPNNLVDQVAGVQAPTLGSDALPSKYYHTIGAAYVTCALVRQGVPGPVVRQIQTTAALNYRRMRLCGLYEDQAIQVLQDRDDSQIAQWVDQIRANPDNNLCADSEGNSLWGTPRCIFFNFEGWFIRDMNEATYARRLAALKSTADAFTLFRRYAPTGSRCERPEILQTSLTQMRRMAHTQNRCLREWSQERCQAARHRLATWVADFDWSGEQHRRGALFATQNCRREPDFLQNGLESRSCAIINQEGGDSIPSGQDTGVVQ
jgi:hypothetical protein